MYDSITPDDVLELGLEDTTWAPPPGVTRHAGVPTEPDADFFADPPEEIGEVLSAESTLKTTKRPWKATSRFVLAGLIGWCGAMLLPLFGVQETAWEVVLFLLIALIVWYLTRFDHTCSFVGKNGLARFRCRDGRTRLATSEVFLFEEAQELRTSQTRHYHNGVYTGTQYNFIWTDGGGKKRFKLSGTYRGEKAPPKPKDPFHLAASAEIAWSVYLLDRSSKELEERGAIRFPLKGGDWLDLGPGFLTVCRKGEIHKLTADVIGDIAVDQGVVKIKRLDAKEGWFSSTGVYKFGYDTMANFHLFGMLYSRLVGLTPRPTAATEEIDL